MVLSLDPLSIETLSTLLVVLAVYGRMECCSAIIMWLGR